MDNTKSTASVKSGSPKSKKKVNRSKEFNGLLTRTVERLIIVEEQLWQRLQAGDQSAAEAWLVAVTQLRVASNQIKQGVAE